jgi:hypothetical protein
MKANKPDKTPNKPIEITAAVEKRSFALLRFIGYILLIFSLIDYLAILLPLRLTDPGWEFQTIGRMVDQVWAPLLGLTFIFLYNQTSVVSSRLLTVLRLLSWFSLALGIVYLLLLPLAINNSLTLYRNLNAQFTNQIGQQQQQLQQFNERLNTVKSPQELSNLARILNVQTEAASSQSLPELKKKLSQQVQTVAQNATTAANAAKRQQIKNLIKESLRVNLGVIVSGFCFITFWNLTRWTRIIDKNVYQ